MTERRAATAGKPNSEDAAHGWPQLTLDLRNLKYVRKGG